MTNPEVKTDYSEPDYAKTDKDTSEYPYYLLKIDKHNLPETQDLLKNYSGIPLDQQSAHIHKIRDKAWAIRKYPCTGLGVWLVPYIRLSWEYPQILEHLKNGDRLLDVGCFLGMDLRRLAYDGAPSNSLYGMDIVSHWDVGFELFRDRDKFRGNFDEIDILDADNGQLKGYRRYFRFISISAVLHQWLLPKQIECARQLVALSSGTGALVVGHQIGNPKAGEVTVPGIPVPVFRHSPDSFREMWDRVSRETGTRWKTTARLRWWDEVGWDPKDYKWMNEGDQVLEFVVYRVD